MNNQGEKPPCPVCERQLLDFGMNIDRSDYDCLNCGKYSLGPKARSFVSSHLGDQPVKRAILSHSLYKMTRNQDWPLLDWPTVEAIVDQGALPNPAQQADGLILLLGSTIGFAGQSQSYEVPQIRSAIGAASDSGARFIVRTLLQKGLIEVETNAIAHEMATQAAINHGESIPLRLSFDGWEKFELLKHGRQDSMKGFMAMKFGEADLDEFFINHLKPAASLAGFKLTKLDDKPKAGLIDDRMRVEILTAKFVVADLTHGNAGAYWEAGFAEGLGKPVIYTCRKDVFDDKTKGTHFDTNHRHTVVWTLTDLADAGRRFKSTIRATLPADAKLED